MFWHSSKLRQYLAAFCSGMCIFCGGASFVWVTPLLVRLEGPDSEVPLTPAQSSWLVSLIEIGNLFTPLPVGFLVDRIGRKPVLLATGPVYIATWILVLTTRSVEVLYLVRIVQGLAMGVQFTVLPMYLGEIAGPEIRGTISVFFQTMWYLGILYVYALGPYVSYQVLTWFTLAPCFVFVGCFAWMPESPYYLVMRGEDERGGEAARWLQGEWEGSQAVAGIKRTLGEESTGGWGAGNLGGRVLGGLLACSVAEELSGLSGVLEYGAGGAEDWWAAVAGIVAAPLAVLLLERSGRRPLLLLGGLGACLSMALAALLPSSPFPVASALLFLSLGPGALTPVLQAELFPSSSRSLASALSTISGTLASFLCLYFYPFLSIRLGLPLLYSLFSVAAISTTSLSYFLIPETRGLTFEEIQQLFKK